MHAAVFGLIKKGALRDYDMGGNEGGKLVFRGVSDVKPLEYAKNH